MLFWCLYFLNKLRLKSQSSIWSVVFLFLCVFYVTRPCEKVVLFTLIAVSSVNETRGNLEGSHIVLIVISYMDYWRNMMVINNHLPS